MVQPPYSITDAHVEARSRALEARIDGASIALRPKREAEMLYWALIFLVVGLVAAALGFTNLAGGAFAIAKFLAGLFLVLFVIFLVLGLTAARKVLD
jgi:uncharacterized membrane protein YtjA (UPF0391 family)